MLASTYSRQSLDVKTGIDTQQKLTRAAVDSRGWSLYKEYADNDTSASKPRGPGSAWAEMLQDARSGAFTHLVATDLDRLLRGQADLLALIDAGVLVVTLDGEIDLSSADGEFRASMMASLARFEVRRKAERQKRASESRAERGIPHRGKRPFGWEHDGVTVIESEAAWIRYAVEETLSGTSLRSIVRHLNEQGVLTSTGREWQGVSLRKLLLRRRNAGVLERYGVRQDVSTITPIITEDEQQRVEAILQARQTAAGAPVRVHWATSLASCGTCGSPLRGHWASTRGARAVYYVCDATIKRSSAPTGEKHPSIRSTLLEGAISDAVASAFLFGSEQLSQTDAPARHALQQALSAAQAARQDVMDLWEAGALTKAESASRLRASLVELESIQERLRTLDSASAAQSMVAGFATAVGADGRVSLDDALEAREALRERFESQSIEKRRSIVEQLLEVTVYPGAGAQRIRIRHRVVESLNIDDSPMHDIGRSVQGEESMER